MMVYPRGNHAFSFAPPTVVHLRVSGLTKSTCAPVPLSHRLLPFVHPCSFREFFPSYRVNVRSTDNPCVDALASQYRQLTLVSCSRFKLKQKAGLPKTENPTSEVPLVGWSYILSYIVRYKPFGINFPKSVTSSRHPCFTCAKVGRFWEFCKL